MIIRKFKYAVFGLPSPAFKKDVQTFICLTDNEQVDPGVAGRRLSEVDSAAVDALVAFRDVA